MHTLNLIILIVKFINCEDLNKADLLDKLNNNIKEAQRQLTQFEELYKLNQRYTQHHTPSNRFVQLHQLPSEFEIREGLYSTQPRRSNPQSSVQIDVKENVKDVVDNATFLASSSIDDLDSFENDLHDMKLSSLQLDRLHHIGDQIDSMKINIDELTKFKPDNRQAKALKKDKIASGLELSCR